mmetsp:Transcript_156/g.559  ORF Transcript_156/g.559 Transcript_156/m.559 type:complete len:269 (+) Transcript_156:160-966(+)
MDCSVQHLGSDSGRGLAGFDSLDSLSVVGGTEDSRAGHQGVGTCIKNLVGIGWGDTAINLNPWVQTPLVAHGPELPDLVDLALDELLAAKAGVDRHDEDEVDLVQHVLDGLQGSAGVEHNAGVAAEVLDHVHDAVQVDGGGLLGVHADDVSAGLCKVSHALLRLDNHQMHVQDLVGHGAEGIHNQGANGDVGHEAAIHHVDVHPVAASIVNGSHLLTKPSEVGREDGGRDDDIALAAAGNALVHAGIAAQRRPPGSGPRGSAGAAEAS